MNQPTIHEEFLGRLTWDPASGGWTGAIPLFPGQLIGILVYQQGELWPALNAARATLDRIADAEFDLRRAAAEALIDDYNEEWNDHFLPLDEEAFSKRLRLENIALFPDGAAELLYDDGGLFEGQKMIIAAAADGSFRGVGFPR